MTKEQTRERKRLWHERNKAKQNARSIAFYNSHKEGMLSQSSQWRRDHLEYSKQKDKERYQLKKEEQITRAKQWRINNPERARLSNLAHKAANKEKGINQAREWHKRHPAMRSFYNNKYRALKKKYSHNLHKIKEYFRIVKSKPTFTCYYCERVLPSSSVHFDHVFPLSKGGQHSVDNLCTSCRSCNSSKRDKFIGVWIKHGQQVFAL